MNKFNKYTRIFFAPAGENDGGGRIVATTLPPVEVSGSGDAGGGGESSSGSGESTTKPSTETPVTTTQTNNTFDPAKFGEELKGIFKTGFEGVKQDLQQKQPQLPPTPEQLAEARKALKFWEPDDSFIQKFSNIETQKDAFIEMRDRMMEQLLTIVEAQDGQRWSSREQQFMSKLSPLEQHYQQQLATKVQADFNKTYPTLADPKYNAIITAVGSELEKTKGYTGQTQEANFKILAERVAQVLQTANPQFTLGGTTPSEKTEQSGNGISSTSTGSGGGGGNSGGSSKPKNALISALGVPKPRG